MLAAAKEEKKKPEKACVDAMDKTEKLFDARKAQKDKNQKNKDKDE